jgi:hypothetical protein
MLKACARTPAPKFKPEAPAAYFDDALTRSLLDAALAGDLAGAHAAVSKGASPDADGPKDNPYNHLRLLHYAIAAGSVPGIRTLMAVSANPEIETLGSAGLPLLFAESLDRPELLSLMLDLRPVDKLFPRTKKLLIAMGLGVLAAALHWPIDDRALVRRSALALA